MSSFSILTRNHDSDGVTLALSGELDMASADELDDQLDQLGDVREVVLDLRELSFLDSSGLRAILRADARARDGGFRLRLVPGSQPVQRVFEVTGAGARLDFIDAGAGE